MTAVVEKLDDLGRPAWIAVMVLGFILFWPAGLAILAYLIWSGRMTCGGMGSRWERKMQRFQDKMGRWNAGQSERPQSFTGSFTPSGNRAFDEYRNETLHRLENEFAEFRSFLDRLREAKDKAEFEQFMTDRRNRPTPSTNPLASDNSRPNG